MADEEVALKEPESGSGVAKWMKNLPAVQPALGTAAAPTDPPPTPTAEKEKAAVPPPPKEPPKEPAKEPAKEPPKEEEETEEKWPRSGDDWQRYKSKSKQREEKLRAEIKEREAKVTEYDGKLKGLETELSDLRERANGHSPEVQAEMEGLKKQIDDYSRLLAAAAVTSHPQFIAHFKGRVDEQIEIAKEIVGPERAEDMAKVLALPDGEAKELRFQEIFAEMSEWERAQFGPVRTELRRIEREKQAEITRASQNRETMQSNSKAAAEEQAAKTKRVFADTLKLMQSDENSGVLWKERDGDTEWNAQVKANVAEAERILLGTGKKLPDIVKASLNAAAYPMLLAEWDKATKASEEKISKLEAQVASLTNAQPKTGSTKPPATGEPPPEPNRPVTPFEASQRFAQRMQREITGE